MDRKRLERNGGAERSFGEVIGKAVEAVDDMDIRILG